jgi:protein-S-isoprenylcysteine O-methyltransferase Ste14
MAILARAITYAVLFVGVILIFVPARLLSWSGIVRPDAIGWQQMAAVLIVVLGAAVALWCLLSFVTVGRGTPAPFDPPRRLVVQGPYRFVRNPMYIGAGLALGGASLYYASSHLLAYTALFFLIAHLFVVGYEEPTLHRTFGEAYQAYCQRVDRWWPRLPSLG